MLRKYPPIILPRVLFGSFFLNVIFISKIYAMGKHPKEELLVNPVLVTSR
jgi:hypothetical protein